MLVQKPHAHWVTLWRTGFETLANISVSAGSRRHNLVFSSLDAVFATA